MSLSSTRAPWVGWGGVLWWGCVLASGNVLFASALHGWCVSLPHFAASTLQQQLQLPAAALPNLTKALWGDWYLRRKRAKKGPQEGAPPQGAPTPGASDLEVRRTPFTAGQPRMVEQLVFEPIWQLYAAAAAAAAGGLGGGPKGAPQGGDDTGMEKLCKMVRALKLRDAEAVTIELQRLLSPERQKRAAAAGEQQREDAAGEIVAALMARWLPVGETLLVS